MIDDTFAPSFAPSVAVAVATDQAAQPPDPPPIPTDAELIFGQVHKEKVGCEIVEFKEVDELLSSEKLGPIELPFQISDVRAVLRGDSAKMLTAKHTIRSVRGFAFMNTVTETTQANAQGLESLPLLATAARVYFVKDFEMRLKSAAFVALLDQKKDEYLTQLDNAARSIQSIGTGAAVQGLATDLVQKHLPAVNLSLSGGTVALNPPQAMLSTSDDDNAIFARACPIQVNNDPFPMPQSEFLLDRIETEKQLVEAYANKVDIAAASATMSKLATKSMTTVFEVQQPYQQKFYSLQQACQPGPTGKVRTPFRLVNRSLAALTDSEGKELTSLLEKLPGRRAVDFSRSVDTILSLDEITSERQAKCVGKFAEELRAVAVVPVHTSRKNSQAVAIHKSQFGTLHGIRKPEDSWKRYLFPVAGSYLADTDNPFQRTVPVSIAAIAAGLMIRHSDKIALPPAGDRMPIDDLSGEVATGWPLEALVNAPDPTEMPGVNRVYSRTRGFHVLGGASTASDEPTFQLASVTRSYNDLVKNISELMLTALFTADNEAAHKVLGKKIDKLIMSKSGTGDDKSLDGGKVVSIENPKNPDGTPKRGVIVLKLHLRLKYVLFGVEIKVIPEDITLVASKDGN